MQLAVDNYVVEKASDLDDANWQLIIKGLIMILAVSLDQYAKRKR